MNRILILSSDPVLKQKNMETLARAGLEVIAVSDCLEGVLRIDKDGFDAIVIDEELPDATNYQCCQRIRQSSDIPIILLGTETDEEVWAKVEDLGFDLYLKKPISPRELVARVKAVLRRAPVKEKPAPEERVAPVPAAPVTPPPKVEVTPPPAAMEPKVTPAPPKPMPTATPEVILAKIWQDVRVTKLIDALVTGRLVEINPEIDLSLKDGFAYPEADKILETSGRETARILESLAEEDILRKRPFVKLLLSPEGSAQIVPVERCPHCDSSEIVKGQVIEHYPCGYVGLEQDFKVGLKYICPKCKKELKLIGTDYRNLGPRYRCSNCHEIFPTPVTKFRCLKTGKSCLREELQEVWLNSYRFNESKRDWLEFELEPKAQLIDFLKLRGYQVEELAKVTGRSGAVHTLDILATRDDMVAKHLIAMGIFAVKPGETGVPVDELFDFDTKAYDIGIHDKVVVAIPKLAPEAQKFAERQRIKVFEAKDLRTLSVGQPQLTPITEPPVTEMKIKPIREEVKPEPPKFAPKAQFIELLKSRGYEVTEKAKIRGRSGAEHVLDIYAQKENGIVSQSIAVAVVTPEEGGEIGIDAISEFDAKTYDLGIHDRMFIAIPKLSPAANQFAKQQGIKVLGIEEIKEFFVTETRPGKESPIQVVRINPKLKLIELLKSRGFEVTEKAKIRGRSGAEHVLDIYARRDDGIVTQTVAAAVATAEEGSEIGFDAVAEFDAKTYDLGIHDRMFIAIPKLSPAANQFAKQQKIRVLEAKDIDTLSVR